MSVIWRQIYVVMAANLGRAQVVRGKVSCKESGKGMERGCQPHGDADRMRQGPATLRTESVFFSLMSHVPLVERGKALSAGKNPKRRVGGLTNHRRMCYNPAHLLRETNDVER